MNETFSTAAQHPGDIGNWFELFKTQSTMTIISSRNTFYQVTMHASIYVLKLANRELQKQVTKRKKKERLQYRQKMCKNNSKMLLSFRAVAWCVCKCLWVISMDRVGRSGKAPLKRLVRRRTSLVPVCLGSRCSVFHRCCVRTLPITNTDTNCFIPRVTCCVALGIVASDNVV